jgi:hypothetical protein
VPCIPHSGPRPQPSDTRVHSKEQRVLQDTSLQAKQHSRLRIVRTGSIGYSDRRRFTPAHYTGTLRAELSLVLLATSSASRSFGRYQLAFPITLALVTESPSTILPSYRTTTRIKTASVIHNGSHYAPRTPHQPQLHPPVDAPGAALRLLNWQHLAHRAAQPLPHQRFEPAGQCCSWHQARCRLPIA